MQEQKLSLACGKDQIALPNLLPVPWPSKQLVQQVLPKLPLFPAHLQGFSAHKLQGTDRHCSEMFNTSTHGAQLSCGLIQPLLCLLCLSNSNISHTEVLLQGCTCSTERKMHLAKISASATCTGKAEWTWPFSFTAKQKCLAEQPVNFLPHSFQGTPLYIH